MNWIKLESEEALPVIIEASKSKPQVIFKHSTSCPTSSLALNRLNRAKEPDGADFHYLDLLRYRAVSNRVATDFNIKHESPQVLVIRDGVCVYDESHIGITMDDIVDALS